MRRIAGLAALLLLVLEGRALHAAQASAKASSKLSAAKVKELVTQWFAADVAGRTTIEAQLAPADALTIEQAKAWVPQLYELARSARKGRKLESGGTNYLIDPKEKVGKYIVGGDKKAKQLIVCLHGGGAGEGDAANAVGGFGGALGKLKSTVVIYPEVLHKTEHGWTHPDTERFVLDLIDAARRTHPLDPNRIYLTGHSMGGFGTWTLGSRHADLFGGLAAFAGAPTPYFDRNDDTKVVGIEDGVLPNLYALPIFVYQSGDDRNVPACTNDFAGAELKRLFDGCGGAGWKHVYERVEGRGHGFPDGGPGAGIAWATSHVRDPRPKKIRWQPSRTWKKCFYWLRCEEPPLGGMIVAEVTAPNRIEITSPKETKGFSVFLDDRLVDPTTDVTILLNGDARYVGLPEPKLTTMLRCLAERLDPEYAFPIRIDLY